MSILDSFASGRAIGQTVKANREARRRRSALEQIGQSMTQQPRSAGPIQGQAAPGTGPLPQRFNREAGASEAIRQGEFELAKMIMEMPDQEREMVARRVQTMGQIAAALQKMPYEQRRQELRSPQYQQALANVGFTGEQIDAYDPTNGNIRLALEQSGKAAEMIKRVNEERKLNQNRYQNETARMNAFTSRDAQIARSDIAKRQLDQTDYQNETARMRAQIERDRLNQPGQGVVDPSRIREIETLMGRYGMSQEEATALVYSGARPQLLAGALRDGAGNIIEGPERIGRLEGIKDATQKNVAARNDSVMRSKALGLADSLRADVENVNKRAAQAVDQTKWSNTGPVFGRLALTGDQVDLEATLDTLGVNSFIATLQEMRNNSPTGGAVGQVTDAERIALSQKIASLNRAQSRPQLDAAIQDLAAHMEGAHARILEAIERDFGGGGFTPSTPAGPSNDDTEALIKKYLGE